MAELSAEAPLAKFESDDWFEYSEFQSAGNALHDESNGNNNQEPQQHRVSNKILDNVKKLDFGGGSSSSSGSMADNFGCETIGGSLEDLVNTFDDKITKCFRDLDQNVESLAPVQIRNQDDIINECPMWWTLTGNYGNILPIDWSKSTARRLQLPTLQLRERQVANVDEVDTLSEEDEAVASDLDLHALIVAPNHGDLDSEPVQSAEEVIKEIDDLMQDPVPTDTAEDMHQSPDTPECPIAGGLRNPISHEKLDTWGVSQLNEFLSELEWSVQHNSETLISELALRDELEFEKELKNTFISLLLNVQNKRRQISAAGQKKVVPSSKNGNPKANGAATHLDAKYITTVIPYHQGNGPPSNSTLQVLIKILRAIVEDSPTVPTLLTDYILKVLCPT